MLIGIVKWFSDEKGYGVVANPDGGDFFLLKINFITTPLNISKGMSIAFTKNFDNKRIEI